MRPTVLISPIKLIILDHCSKPRTWTEIINKTNRSHPTIMKHLDDLQNLGLLIKTNRFYKTNFKNKEAIRIARNILKLEDKLSKILEGL